ncbi:hypothetical protein BpHYR1_031612 [Brachionus plicatilis]|uniref:Uncharacterized protein n=1 Tax=Brachionus plicatilis TaxID=10195 RepID=A0A3M7SIE4_BRAPC|nr:hypothetical protein BpHYR1_031612 [Brachionus plicatilis]
MNNEKGVKLHIPTLLCNFNDSKALFINMDLNVPQELQRHERMTPLALVQCWSFFETILVLVIYWNLFSKKLKKDVD